jgi:stage 0 sporulation protein B (sporulation initiation phosphotransferase)
LKHQSSSGPAEKKVSGGFMQDAHKVVEALRHYRHDYLNDIQLIKSYTVLGKTEKVNQVIDRISRRAEQESRLSSLNAPMLAEFLLTYNGGSPMVPLETVKVYSSGDDWSGEEAEALNFLKEFTSWADKAADTSVTARVAVTLKSENSRLLIVEFNGRLQQNEIPYFLKKNNVELDWHSTSVNARIRLDE